MTPQDLPCSSVPVVPAPATGVAALRQHTAPRHRALEATPLACALLSPALGRPGYRRVLAAWSMAIAALEQVVAASPHAAALGPLVPAPRHALALGDLQALAASAAAAEAPAAAPAPHAPHAQLAALRAATATPAGLLGLCYVLRGASLGSQVIARHLRTHLGLDASSGAAYFGTEPAGAPSWPRWMAAADAHLADARATRLALGGAEAAFDALIDAFSAAPARMDALA